MDWEGEAVAVLDELHRVATSVRQAVLSHDLAALPVLAEREAELAGRLSRALEQAPGAPMGRPARDLPGPLRERARAWWTLHRQNRMLLQHAHQTVVALLGIVTGVAQEPTGLYSDGGGPWPGAGHAGRNAALTVDQRV